MSIDIQIKEYVLFYIFYLVKLLNTDTHLNILLLFPI